MNLLIAEGNASLQKTTALLMERWGFTFDMVSNGKEAVQQAVNHEGKYDLCLMGIDIPGMNGYEAVKRIRQKCSYFPIMALSGNPGIRDNYSQSEIDDYLEKPYSIDKLRQKISELTVKLYRFGLHNEHVLIKKEMPVDKQEAEELRELARKGLRKVSFFDSPGKAITVHENVINKISHDFNVKGQLLTTFINRDDDKPTLCHLFKESSCLLPQTLLFEEEYAAMLEEENKELNNYKTLSLNAQKE